MEENILSDEAMIESLKEMAIKFSNDSYANRVLANAIRLIEKLQRSNEQEKQLVDDLTKKCSEIYWFKQYENIEKKTAKDILNKLLKSGDVETIRRIGAYGESYESICIDLFKIEDIAETYGVVLE